MEKLFFYVKHEETVFLFRVLFSILCIENEIKIEIEIYNVNYL